MLDLPELSTLQSYSGVIRIPPELDVPLTDRVKKLIDTAAFRRLSKISQLGLVSLVYPAANHTRFEHSLGVYKTALLFLNQLAQDGRFAAEIGSYEAKVFLVASLLHDIGHWPFCHPIEDISLPGVPEHEQFAKEFILQGEISEVLKKDWAIEPADVVALLAKSRKDTAFQILSSLLSGPIDVDKMDYLMRDSLHAGVPYGRNFDQARLIHSLCLDESGTGLAITDKGKTAAEMMVFARYVMFSEVYWHHTVRSATAMFQRAFVFLHASMNIDTVFRSTEHSMIRQMIDAIGESSAKDLLHGLFGKKRQLYKTIAQYSLYQNRSIYERIARKPYSWLVACSMNMGKVLSKKIGQAVLPEEVLFDSPPMELEVEFQIDVFLRKEQRYSRLGDLSPVVETLARKQFDDYVKRVRVFVHPRLQQRIEELQEFEKLVEEAISLTDD